MLARRGLLRGLLGMPAVVAAGSLMPVRAPLWAPKDPYRIKTHAMKYDLRVGDVITFKGVETLSKYSAGRLRQFVVTAQAPAGARALSIYPELSYRTVVNPYTRSDFVPELVSRS